MQYLLHIDTSADNAVVALNGDGLIIASSMNREVRNHAGSINLLIESLLEEATISLKNLSGIVVCAGPGSYTGLRIGLATAKGLCYALDIPLILDNRLTLLAWQSFKKSGKDYDNYVALLVARNKEYFIAIYNNEFHCTVSPCHVMEEQLELLIENKDEIFLITDMPVSNIAFVNHARVRLENDINIALNHWAFYAFERYKCHNIEILSTAEPFYLKQVYTHK
jgi:tRNA threonylcarbamoyladenosine biosynthesis protein TsaB